MQTFFFCAGSPKLSGVVSARLGVLPARLRAPARGSEASGKSSGGSFDRGAPHFWPRLGQNPGSRKRERGIVIRREVSRPPWPYGLCGFLSRGARQGGDDSGSL